MFRWLFGCRHPQTRRETRDGIRLFVCNDCGYAVEQIQRTKEERAAITAQPAHVSMKSQRTPRANVAPIRRAK